MADPLRRITTRLSEQFTYSAEWDKTKNPSLTPLREHLDRLPGVVVEGGFRHRPEGPQPESAVAEEVVPVFGVKPSKVLSFGRGDRFTQTRYRF